MGLDHYLHKRTIDTKKLTLQKLKGKEEYEIVAEWRKVYPIHEWFCNNFEVENCKEVEIQKEDLQELLKDIADDPDFFKETYVYEEEEKAKIIAEIEAVINETDWDNEIIEYYAWW